MTIVFVCGGYYPNTSATGNCVRKIADVFTELGHKVIIVCKSGDGSFSEEVYKGQYIYRVTNRRLKERVKLADPKVFFRRFHILIHKSKWAIYGLLQVDGLEKSLLRAYKNQLESISEMEEIDAVVPCCMPVECMIAAYQFVNEKQNMKLFPLLYDLYSDNINFFRFKWNHFFRKSNAKEWERKVITASEKVFYVDNWGAYFSKNLFPNIVRVEHPLIVNRERHPLALQKRKNINAIYQGEINYQMRPPSAMLKAFEYLISLDSQISLHICAYGNSTHEVKAVADRNSDNIIFYGKVNKDIADGYYDDANVAVVLGNKNSSLVPSKIFECIASGYPIVYFYYTENETAYRLLKKYPLVFFINQNDNTEKSYRDMYSWLLENKDKRIAFDVVQNIFSDATPDYVVETICELIDKKIEAY